MVACLLIALACLSPAAGAADPAPLTASQFADLIERLSEQGGYFWNDNYVSNEASYLHPLAALHELGLEGGVYLGVGPNQNFTYVAKLRPSYCFIVDIRQQNLLQHLMFKALFHFARSRVEYLSLLLSRPIPKSFPAGDEYTAEDLVRHFQRAEPDQTLFRRTRARIRMFLTEAVRVPISERDFGSIDKIHRAFFLRGLGIKYDYVPVPSYAEFLLETDLRGQRQNFLNAAQDFRFLKRMHEENRIIPVVGDFAGKHALQEIGNYLRRQNLKVTVFYTSNVEQILVQELTWPQFLKNAASLPLDDRAVFIRSYWSNHLLHPQSVPGYRFTQVVQPIRQFLRNFKPGPGVTYWDIVTADSIPLR
ncbi:MAG: hypothetical protein ABIG68_10835 [Acidobacteriota bacterium]